MPLHIIVDRDSLAKDEKDPPGFIETEDFVELNGMAGQQHLLIVHDLAVKRTGMVAWTPAVCK